MGELAPRIAATMRPFTAYIEWDPSSEVYTGSVPSITGAHTQAATLEALRENLREVLELCLEEHQIDTDELPVFVGTLQVQVGHQEKISNLKSKISN